MRHKHMTEYYAAVRIIEKATLNATWVVLKNRSKKVRNRVPGSVSHIHETKL